MKPRDNTPQAIETAKTEAKAAAVELKIDRLAAKVTVSVNGTGVTVPTGAHFAFQGWDLNITNKSVRLYTDLVSYANATTGAAKGVYRKDKNYTVAEQPSTADEMKAAFNYLTNGAAPTHPTCRPWTKPPERTCTALRIRWRPPHRNSATPPKRSSRRNMLPPTFYSVTATSSGTGLFFTLEGIKAAYLTHAEGTGLRVDLPEFLHKAGIMADGVFGGNLTGRDAAVAGLKADDFNATSGIVGRYCAVRYYHQSVCYYDVLIRHDQNVTDKMALGKYGVVRNNWYGLQINSVSNPGTPWIPDRPIPTIRPGRIPTTMKMTSTSR